MTSCSSYNWPTSMHPYHDELHQSTASLQMKEKWRSIFSKVKAMFHKEDLPPLPKGTGLSSSSHQPLTLLALPHMSFNLSPPFQTMPLLSARYDFSWAQATIAGHPLPNLVPLIVTDTQGYQLHHPQPHSILTTSGIISQFPTVPISLPTSPCQQTSTFLLSSTGTNPFKTGNSHQSLNQLPDHPVWSNLPGDRLMSDISGYISTDSVKPTGQESGQASQAV